MSLRAVLLTLLLWSGSAAAQAPDPAEAARAAAAQLEEATLALQEADKARDRVKALTETVRAYEAGLAAMRDGLRRAARRETQLTAQLEARQSEIAQLLGTLQTIEASPPPVLILHPAGPLGSARSAMMLAEITPALTARAERLKAAVQEVQTLRLLQESAVEILEDGLAGAQSARAALSKAIADRTDLPRRFVEDPVRTAILIDSVETLDGFASGLSEIAEGEIAEIDADVSTLKGELALPVEGIVLHRMGDADAAGIERNGIVVATRPRALVTAPASATIRYLGPLLDLGNVAILEPQPGTLFVLSGLAEVFGVTGQVIPEGTPVGLMGGADAEMGAILSTSGEGAGAERPETLYIEVREGGSPVDPESWFRTDRNG